MARREGQRGAAGYHHRKVGVRPVIARFLIVCEGEKTEPQYFDRFRMPTVVIRTVGTGRSSIDVVREAVKRRQDDDYDQVWCVFDRDRCEARDFRDAIAQADRLGLRVAYSNEAFELWFLLHFIYFDTAVRREDYEKKLGQHLGHPYDKTSARLYAELETRQDTAIAHAARLLASHPRADPEANNPSTTVHLLVQELNKNRRR